MLFKKTHALALLALSISSVAGAREYTAADFKDGSRIFGCSVVEYSVSGPRPISFYIEYLLQEEQLDLNNHAKINYYDVKKSWKQKLVSTKVRKAYSKLLVESDYHTVSPILDSKIQEGRNNIQSFRVQSKYSKRTINVSLSQTGGIDIKVNSLEKRPYYPYDHYASFEPLKEDGVAVSRGLDELVEIICEAEKKLSEIPVEVKPLTDKMPIVPEQEEDHSGVQLDDLVPAEGGSN